MKPTAKFKNYFERKHLKNKLQSAFKLGKLYYERNYKGNKLTQYPSILEVRPREDKVTYVFKLPHGLNPEEVFKKEYVFKSIFQQELIEIKDKLSLITLTVYKIVHNGFYPFDFEQIQSFMYPFNLPIIAGKDIHGNFHVYDMVVHPHLLITGETGSGKSVMLLNLFTSLILHFRKGGLQVHLCDLKLTEFHVFENVDIVKNVIFDIKKAHSCVAWFKKQLDIRGQILKEHGVNHIDKYNKIKGVKKLDYLILGIDEFSLLRKEETTMDNLTDIASLGRALGIYLVLSCQRADAKVIDGLLKANLNVKYAFRANSSINSRITLGEGSPVDAFDITEEEKGRFYISSGYKLLQSPFIDTEDKNITIDGIEILVKGVETLLAPYKVIKIRTNEEPKEEAIEADYEVVAETTEDIYEEDNSKDFAPFIIEEE